MIIATIIYYIPHAYYLSYSNEQATKTIFLVFSRILKKNKTNKTNKTKQNNKQQTTTQITRKMNFILGINYAIGFDSDHCFLLISS